MHWIALAGLLVVLTADRLAAEDLSCSTPPPITELGETEATQLDSLTRKAMACVRSGSMDMAIDIFSQMISIDPDNKTAYMNRANAYIQSGRAAQGLADLSFLINVEPTFAEAWFNRGIGYLVIQKYDRAIADFGETLRLKPHFAKAYCNRGLARLRKGEVDAALDDLNAGLQQSSSLEMCYFARGEVHFRKNEFQKAVDDYTSGLALKPDLGVLNQRALAHERLGDSEKALADFKAVLARVPSHQAARDGVLRLSEIDTE